MPTYLVGPTRPYTTIQSAIDAIPSNLTGTGLHEIVIDAGTYEPFFLSKTNGSASNYVSITCAADSYHNGLFTAGVIISGSGNEVRSNFTEITDVVLTNNGGTSGLQINFCNNVYCENVIARRFGTGSNTRVFFVGFGATNCLFYKCLADNQSGGVRYGWRIENTGCVLVNCGAYTNVRGFSTTVSNNTIAINCWAFGSSGPAFEGTWNSQSRNNASSDGSAPGANSVTSLTLADASFLSSTNYHITSASRLYNTGFSQASRFTEDIDKENIAVWCIGPDCFSTAPASPTTSSSPWINQNTPHEEVEDAETPKLVTKSGEPSQPLSKSPRDTKDAKAPKLKTQGGGSSPSLQSSKSVSEVSATSKPAPKGYKDGYLSIMPEAGGYSASSLTLGTGNRLHFYSDDLGVNKEFVDCGCVTPSRAFQSRVDVGQDPSGGFVSVLKSNDCIPILQSHFQKRIGTTPASGTTYYEFSPNRGQLLMTGSSFGTGSYNSTGTWSAFTLSAFKAVNGSAYHFKTGVCDSLKFSFDARGEAIMSPSMVFKNVELIATNTGLPTGSASSLQPFYGHQFSVDFFGLPVVKFDLESKNNIKKFRRVGTSGYNHQFGRYEVTGQATVDLSKLSLAHFGSMLSAGSFSVVGTLYSDERNKMVFDMPNVVLKPYELNLNTDTVNVPFSCYESEDGGTAPLTIKLWTRNYSGTSFEPN